MHAIRDCWICYTKLHFIGLSEPLAGVVASSSHESRSEMRYSAKSIEKIPNFILQVTDETKNMVNKSSFAQMKNKPIIINTSRGGIINERDLIEAYHKNIISGFALDVFENEPIESKFYHKIKPGMNCILTPHISGVTTESNIRVSDFIVKKITDFFN